MRHVVAQNALPQYLQDAIAQGQDRCVCPRCDGGTQREASLSLRPHSDGVVSFKCYRASCNWFGLTLTDPNAVYDFKKIKIGRVYRDPTFPLAGCVKDSMVIDYGLDPKILDERGWRMNERGDTLVIPIKDRNGLELGHITRTVTLPEKRVFTYKATAMPFLDVWLSNTASPVVVVEDCLSAARLFSLGYSAVSLMGTNLSNADAQEIARLSKPTVLALDRDAFDKALKLRDRHAHVLPIDRVLCLTEDIKNMENDDDIRRLVGE